MKCWWSVDNKKWNKGEIKSRPKQVALLIDGDHTNRQGILLIDVEIQFTDRGCEVAGYEPSGSDPSGNQIYTETKATVAFNEADTK